MKLSLPVETTGTLSVGFSRLHHGRSLVLKVVSLLGLVFTCSFARAQTQPAEDPTHFIHLMAPVGGQHFYAPALVRVFLSASDVGNWPDQNRAASVDIMVDNTVQTTIPGGQSEYWVYKTNLTGIAAGAHRIWARGHFVDGKTFDSEAATITVDPPPSYAQVVNLTGNVLLTGSQNYELIGSPSGRIRINGNGFSIRSSDTWTGRLTLKYVSPPSGGARSRGRGTPRRSSPRRSAAGSAAARDRRSL